MSQNAETRTRRVRQDARIEPEAERLARGDVSLALSLIERAFTRWSTQEQKEAAWQALTELETVSGGLLPIVEKLNAYRGGSLSQQLKRLREHRNSDAVRVWAALRLAELEPVDTRASLLAQLSVVDDWRGNKNASDALTLLQNAPINELNVVVHTPSLSSEHRLWAARTLLVLGEKVNLNEVPRARVELPEVPMDIRETIVRAWGADYEPGTDVRWLVEFLQLPPSTQTNPEQCAVEHEGIVELLRMNGVPAGSAVSAGHWHGEGWGTYSSIDIKRRTHFLRLSTLGRYAALSSRYDRQPVGLQRRRQIRKALDSAGWELLDFNVQETIFSGLNIYFFGRREPLSVHNLLFYWQD